MSNFRDYALWLHSLGANVTAIETGTKGPAHKWEQWHDKRQEQRDVTNLPWNGYTCRIATKRHKIGDKVTIGGVGVINGPGGWHTFDIDARKDEHGAAIVVSDAAIDSLLDALHLPRDYAWVWRGKTRAGWALALGCDAPMPPGVLPAKKDEAGVAWGWPANDSGADWHHLELRYANCQTVYPPSEGYEWRHDAPTEAPATVPIHRVIDAFFALSPPQPHTLGSIDRATIDAIKQRFDLVGYAVQAFGGETQDEGTEVRVLGHSGLLINPDKLIWHCFGDEIGGDCFDLIAYDKYRTTARNLNGKSTDVLIAAAEFAGITLPERKPDQTVDTSSPRVHPEFTPTSEQGELRTPKLLHASRLGDIPPTTWLIDGVLAMNKLSQTFAPPGSGKSFLELDKALCVAQRYPVIYVAAEAVEDYEERVAAWEEHHGQEAGQLYFWPEPIILRDPASVEAFLTEIHPIGPAAIFIDPLASCMVGLEESSTGDMTLAVEALNRIRRETGAAMHIVHHTGWNDEHERGSSVLRAACRIVMKLSLDDSGLMTLSCAKANNGKPFEARYFRLVESGPSAVPVPTNKLSTRDAPLSEKQFAIMETLDLMHLRDGATFSQIQEHTTFAKSTVNKAIARLLELGSIDTVQAGRAKYFRLTPTGNGQLAARLAESVAGARSPVHQGGELKVNWMVNSELMVNSALGSQTVDRITKPNSEVVHPEFTRPSSPEFTSATAAECASSPEFTASSPSVHPTEFTSSPLAPPLGGEMSELVNSEQVADPYRVTEWLEDPPRYTVTEWTDAGPVDLPGEHATLEDARAAMPPVDPAYRDIGRLNRRPPNVNVRRAVQEEAEAAKFAAQYGGGGDDDEDIL
jgi:DNA-binding MarR family transcriptional regulator